jgi:hypothetical protein
MFPFEGSISAIVDFVGVWPINSTLVAQRLALPPYPAAVRCVLTTPHN